VLFLPTPLLAGMASRTCNPQALAPGAKLFEVSHYIFKKMDGDNAVVTDASGGEVIISRSLLEKSIYSTHQYDKEERMTRTELAQKIETLGHAAFQVKFRKQVSSNDVADGIADQAIGNQAKRRKLLKQLMEGELRTMNARLYRTADFDASIELGRYRVVDLDELEKHRDNEARCLRMVDTRTIAELIVENVRYFT